MILWDHFLYVWHRRRYCYCCKWVCHHSVIVFVQLSLWCRMDWLHSNNRKVDDAVIRTVTSPVLLSGRNELETSEAAKLLQTNSSVCAWSSSSLQSVWLSDGHRALWEHIAEITITPACCLISAVSVFLHNQILSSRNRIADEMQWGHPVSRTSVEW